MKPQTNSAISRSSQNDFDFLHGNWTVSHQRLRRRLAECQDWDRFDGTSRTTPTLNGSGNIEDNFINLPGQPHPAVALRSYDSATGQWAIWWLDGRVPHQLDVPVKGGFDGDTGQFLADDRLDGQPIVVRFLWRKGARPRWEQAFSTDGGRTWETNWIMDFTPAPE